MRRQARGAGLQGPGTGQRALPCGMQSGLLCAVLGIGGCLCPLLCPRPASPAHSLWPRPVPRWLHGSSGGRAPACLECASRVQCSPPWAPRGSRPYSLSQPLTLSSPTPPRGT